VTARVLADKLSKRWGKPVFVENKAGANGVIGTETIAHAEPDGHTMGLVASSHVTNHALMKSVPYALADMTPVTITAQVQLGLVVHPSVPASTVRELVAYAKANPDKLAVATSAAEATRSSGRSPSCRRPARRWWTSRTRAALPRIRTSSPGRRR
jgi:tripartite-type tricarboxylate transporter receptor subunit TctC